MAGRERPSGDYMRRYRLPELMQRLGALLLYHRPESPREFLIQVLERVKAGKRDDSEYPYLIDEGNLEAMFRLLEVVSQDHITAAQYRDALKTLGLSTEDVQFEDDLNITLDSRKDSRIFQEEVKKKMLKSWAVLA